MEPHATSLTPARYGGPVRVIGGMLGQRPKVRTAPPFGPLSRTEQLARDTTPAPCLPLTHASVAHEGSVATPVLQEGAEVDRYRESNTEAYKNEDALCTSLPILNICAVKFWCTGDIHGEDGSRRVTISSFIRGGGDLACIEGMFIEGGNFGIYEAVLSGSTQADPHLF